MQFVLYYKDYKTKEEDNRNLRILSIFLNFHLREKFHGSTFERIYVYFSNFPKSSKNLILKSSSNKYADVEVKVKFESNQELSIEQFQQAFNCVLKAVNLVDNIEIPSTKDYKVKELEKDLKQLVLPKTIKELKKLEDDSEKLRKIIVVRYIDGLIKVWKEKPQKHNKRIIHMRIYCNYFIKNFTECAVRYSSLFSILLHNQNISAPGYIEIFFYIGETLDDAKQAELPMEKWYKNTYCVLDLKKFSISTEEERSKMLFDSLKGGLLLIADFDHLNKEKIQKVIQFIEENKFDSELTYKTKTTKNITASIVFKISKEYKYLTPFWLKIQDKTTKKKGKVKIDDILYWSASYSFVQLKIKKDTIEIIGSKSLRSKVYRKSDKIPDSYSFEINKILKN